MNDDDLDDYKKPYQIDFEGDISDWSQFRIQAIAEGYTGEAPRRNPSALVDGKHIDQEVAEAGVCVKCQYRALYGFGEYRAFAVCPKCNKAQEF